MAITYGHVLYIYAPMLAPYQCNYKSLHSDATYNKRRWQSVNKYKSNALAVVEVEMLMEKHKKFVNSLFFFNLAKNK